MRRALPYALILGTAVTVGAQPAPARTSTAGSAMRTEAFTLKSYDGRERAAERVRLTVPADPVAPDGRTLEIVFDRLRAPGTATRPLVPA